MYKFLTLPFLPFHPNYGTYPFFGPHKYLFRKKSKGGANNLFRIFLCILRTGRCSNGLYCLLQGYTNRGTEEESSCVLAKLNPERKDIEEESHFGEQLL